MNQKIYNLIILDASGSMYSIRNEAIAGVVETIQTIRTAQEENADQEQMLSLVVFNGKRIGIKTGSAFEAITLETFPYSEFFYYETESDLLQALRANKIDAFLDDEPVAAMMHAEQPDVNYLKNVIVDDDHKAEKKNVASRFCSFHQIIKADNYQRQKDASIKPQQIELVGNEPSHHCICNGKR